MILEGIAILSCLGASGLFLNRFYFSGGVCKSKKRLDGKVTIITGGNTGIGYETALDFAKRGARVILACRDMNKANKAASEMIKLSNNNKIECEKLDLADLASVRAFAEVMNSKLTRLDILINNAGIMMCPYWKTKDGFEMQFGTNHLGHFLLTNLLLDLMKKTFDSRIVNVSSLAHESAEINWNDINWTKRYDPIKAYGQSKLANVLFTNELSLRLGSNSNVSVYSLHPGVIRTELLRYAGEGLFFLLPYLLIAFSPIFMIFTKSPSEGAQTTIHCAVSEDAYEYKGCYFSDCKPKTPSVNARNPEFSKRLWEISEKLIKISNEN